MRKIQLDNNARKLHLRYWRTKIKDELQKVANAGSTDLHKYLQYCAEHWRVLAVGNVSCLRKFQKKLTLLMGSAFMETLEAKEYQDQAGNKHKIVELFGYNSFNKNLTKKEIDNSFRMVNQTVLSKGELENIPWAPYLFVFMLPIRTCPYCNRQYITPLVQDKTETAPAKRLRAVLDHFWPKHKYPHFSMSLYNLVPSCGFCNTSLKNIHEFSLDDPSPYECNYDDYFRFEIDLKDLSFSSIEIKTDLIDERIKPILDMFAIEGIYKYHSNIAQEFVQKRICYPDRLLESLLYIFEAGNFYDSIDELRAVLLGFPKAKDQIDDEALGKLKYDLACEVGFVKPEIHGKELRAQDVANQTQ